MKTSLSRSSSKRSTSLLVNTFTRNKSEALKSKKRDREVPKRYIVAVLVMVIIIVNLGHMNFTTSSHFDMHFVKKEVIKIWNSGEPLVSGFILLILSQFASLPFGYIVDYYGVKVFLLTSIFCCTATNLFQGICYSLNRMDGIRKVEPLVDLGTRVIYPCAAAIIVRWLSRRERATLCAILGNMPQLLIMVSGIATVFRNTTRTYVYTCYLWIMFDITAMLMCIVFIHDSPNQHPYISAREKFYLNQNTDEVIVMSTPIKEILMDVHFWIIILLDNSTSYLYMTLLNLVPNGMYRYIVGASSYGLGIIIGIIEDWLVFSKHFKVTVVRCTSICLGLSMLLAATLCMEGQMYSTWWYIWYGVSIVGMAFPTLFLITTDLTINNAGFVTGLLVHDDILLNLFIEGILPNGEKHVLYKKWYIVAFTSFTVVMFIMFYKGCRAIWDYQSMTDYNYCMTEESGWGLFNKLKN